MSAGARQVGGTHYLEMPVQPRDLTVEHDLNGLEHSAVKYLSRHPSKGGIEDTRKALHFCEMAIEDHDLVASYRAGYPALKPAISAAAYCAANGLGDLETAAICQICEYRATGVRAAMQAARDSVLALIHQMRIAQEGTR